MMRRWSGKIGIGLLLIAAGVGCRTAPPASVPLPAQGTVWNSADAAILEWNARDPAFGQERGMEASGLVFTQGFLFTVAEKYSRVLRIDPLTLDVEAIALDLPRYSEMEGITVAGDRVLICDEANAALWSIDSVADLAGSRPVIPVKIDGSALGVSGGKLGLEGITVARDEAGLISVVLERRGNLAVGCHSDLFQGRIVDGAFVVEGDPVAFPLEDCRWRLSGLQWWKGHLLALKTHYPVERYEVVALDLESGTMETLLDLTAFLLEAEENGWGNNAEGLAVDDSGNLWVITDNAMTDRVEGGDPPPVRDKTLLIRIPPVAGR